MKKLQKIPTIVAFAEFEMSEVKKKDIARNSITVISLELNEKRFMTSLELTGEELSQFRRK